jgi:regulation of enolase protein 1 (concanavalin A-like superfamily)
VAGAGNISSTADNFRFVYQPMTGDGEIRARIVSATGTLAGSRVGVMIRETLTAGSRQAYMGYNGATNLRFYRRTTTGGTTSSTNANNFNKPYWVRLVRTGNTITAYRSSNGTSWTTVGTATVTMGTNIYLGLAVSSGDTTTLNTATFNNVTATP